MDLVTFILIAFLAITFIIFPGVGMAMVSNTPVKDFFIGALIIPVLFTWCGLYTYAFFNMPDEIMNDATSSFITFVVFMIAGPAIGALVFVKVLKKIYE